MFGNKSSIILNSHNAKEFNILFVIETNLDFCNKALFGLQQYTLRTPDTKLKKLAI